MQLYLLVIIERNIYFKLRKKHLITCYSIPIQIDVQFKIDQTGKVVDIKTRAPHPALEKEAKRVINKIPEMKPGMQQDKPVGVLYNLPIKFNVQD